MWKDNNLCNIVQSFRFMPVEFKQNKENLAYYDTMLYTGSFYELVFYGPAFYGPADNYFFLPHDESLTCFILF